MCIFFYSLKLQIAPPLGFMEMDIAKMKPTMLNATMMVVTVVDLVLLLNTAQNANVLEEKLAMIFLMH